MSVPANDPRRAEAAKRLTRMPLSGLIAEWEERLFDSDRVLLAEELAGRGYRIKSLPLPTEDLQDSSASAAADARARSATETAEEAPSPC